VNISCMDAGKKELHMLGIILVAVLILALLGALLRWTHSRDWGYYPEE
jgi:Protein of unknown function (DUF3309)